MSLSKKIKTTRFLFRAAFFFWNHDMNEDKTADPRVGIDIPGLVGALQDHVLNGKKMTTTQVNAAIALLKKVLPDLPAPVRRPDEDKKQKTYEEVLQELDEQR